MKRPHLHVKRPISGLPHLPGLFELERLADDTVVLAEQIKSTVAELREEESARSQNERTGDGDEPRQ